MKNAETLKKQAQEKGFAKISDGVYLATKDHMIAEQENWGDKDNSKKTDFSSAEYWIWPEGDADCEAVYEDTEIEQYLV